MHNHQSPLHSGFGPTSTAKDVTKGIDLSGKIAIVTGGYSGLGLETTRSLASAGATVIVPARTPAKAFGALTGIERVEIESLDLMDPASIRQFADTFLTSNRLLHILVNSAGIMATPLARDARGYESQFSSNHLGHFQLAGHLWPALCPAGGARVVSVSSRGHRFSDVDFEDPNFQSRPYDRWKAYGQSKTANALFAVGLDKRGKRFGVRAFSLHPGSILTDLSRHLTDQDLQSFGVTRDTAHGFIPEGKAAGKGGDFKTAEQGAATAVWCATSPQLSSIGGVYCENVDVAKAVSADDPAPEGVRPWAVDAHAADQLWALSEKLTGTTYPT